MQVPFTVPTMEMTRRGLSWPDNHSGGVRLSMSRWRAMLAFVAMGCLVATMARGQGESQAASSPPESAKKAGRAAVQVCLRLEDGMPFLGEASVRMKPSEGEELGGVETSTMGDYQFSDTKPGKYLLEVSAPGFLPQQFKTEVEPGGGQRTLFVVMKRREVSAEEPKAPEPPPDEVKSEPRLEGEKAEPKVEPVKAEPKLAPGARDYWRDHELELVVPHVEEGVACPLEKVLTGAGVRMSEFVNTLEKFTATESVEHYFFNKFGEAEKPENRRFAYVVMVSQNRLGTFLLEEFRDGSTDPELFPGHIATLGLPAMALIFHPLFAQDFDIRCEGMGQWGGHEMWQLHFSQRDDHPVRIRAYNVNRSAFAVYLEGRAWIDPGSFQVVHLETELKKQIPEIQLTKEHMAIDYAPVRFAHLGAEIWLPQSAEQYVERRQRRFYRKHSFSDFKLFNVETAQALQAPRGSYSFTNTTDQDVSGELTVMWTAGTEGKVLSLRFTVPARGRVIKMVGPGKDLNVPGASIVAARFVYTGKEGAVRVDANLVKDSTLDVMPEE